MACFTKEIGLILGKDGGFCLTHQWWRTGPDSHYLVGGCFPFSPLGGAPPLPVVLLRGCGSLLLVSLPVRAQQDGVPYNAIRALNLARNTGVTLNGGLSVYRPAACMFTTSALPG